MPDLLPIEYLKWNSMDSGLTMTPCSCLLVSGQEMKDYDCVSLCLASTCSREMISLS